VFSVTVEDTHGATATATVTVDVKDTSEWGTRDATSIKRRPRSVPGTD